MLCSKGCDYRDARQRSIATRAGRCFLLGSAASAKAYNAHEKAMNEILDSIKPVEGEDKS